MLGREFGGISCAKSEQETGSKSTNYTDRLNYPLLYYVSYSSESSRWVKIVMLAGNFGS